MLPPDSTCRTPAGRLRIAIALFLLFLVFPRPGLASRLPQGWTVVSSTAEELRLRIEVPRSEVQEVRQEARVYGLLRLPGYRGLGEPGLPLLPQRGVWVGLPPEGSFRLGVEILDVDDLPPMRLLPCPMPAPSPRLPPEEIDGVIERFVEGEGYAHWGRSSEEIAVLGEVVWSNGQRMVPLRVCPFVVGEAGARLQQVRALEVTIRFTEGAAPTAAVAEVDPATLQRLVNPTVARRWHASSPADRLRVQTSTPSVRSLEEAPETAVAAGEILPVDEMVLLSDEYRIPVERSGLVRVHLSDLFGELGFPTGIRHDQLRLYIKRPSVPGSAAYPVPLSEDVPVHFFGDPDPASEITGSDIVIFYGFNVQEDNVERLVGGGTLPAAMEQRADNYNSANIYWLAAADPGSGSWARMQREAFSAATGAPRSYYDYQESFGQDAYYQPNAVSPSETRYLWNSPRGQEGRLPLRLRSIDPSSPLIVRWVFCSNIHLQQPQELRTSFYLEREDGSNRTLLGTFDINGGLGEFDPGPFGAPTAVRDTLPPGAFQPGSLFLRFHNEDEASSIYHLVMVDSVSLYYRAAYRAESEKSVFDTGVVGSEASLEIPGFTAEEIFLVETTDPRAPRWVDLSAENIVIDGADRTLSLQVPGEGSSPRSFIAVASVEVPRVTDAEITRSDTPVLTSKIGEVQAIALGPRQFESAMAPWLQWRRDHDRKGWNYAYVDVQEVFDQFAGGLHSPDAIKEFLHYAHLQWGAKAVLLVGDANEDHRRILRDAGQPAGVEDFVPTHEHMLFYGDFEVAASDKWYVLFDIDDRQYPRLLNKGPDMLLGRWPAQNAGQVSAMVAKHIAYEQPAATDTWRQRVIWMSDDAYSTGTLLGGGSGTRYRFSSAETQFQSTQEFLAAQSDTFLDGTMDGSSWALDDWTAPVRGDETDFPVNFLSVVQQEVASTARPALYATLSEGAFMLNYQGHANYNVFAHEQIVLNVPGLTSPVEEIDNVGKPFLLISLGCHASDYIRTNDLSVNVAPSFGEIFVTCAGSGAIASYGSSTYEYLLPNLALGEVIGDVFFGDTRSGQVLDPAEAQWILGDVMAQVEWDVFSATTTQIPQMVAQYVLLGDPLLRMDGASPRVSLHVDGLEVGEDAAVLPAAGARSLHLQVDVVDESGVDRIELIETVDGESHDLTGLLQPQTGEGLDARRARSLAELPVVAQGTEGGVQYELRAYDRAYPHERPRSFRFHVPFELVVHLDGDVLPPSGRPVAPGEVVDFLLDLTSPITLASDEIEIGLSGLEQIGDLHKQQQDDEGRQWQIDFQARGQAGANEQSVTLRLAGQETVISLAGTAEPVELQVKSHYPIPNPADPSSGPIRIVADLSAPAAWARVTVYDLSGRPVVSWEDHALGLSTQIVLRWDGRDRRGDELANGTYLYKLEVADGEGRVHRGEMGRIVLMR